MRRSLFTGKRLNNVLPATVDCGCFYIGTFASIGVPVVTLSEIYAYKKPLRSSMTE